MKRKLHRKKLFVKIGKIIMQVVLIGALAITVFTVADNGLYETSWNNLTEQVQEETTEDVVEDTETKVEE